MEAKESSSSSRLAEGTPRIVAMPDCAHREFFRMADMMWVVSAKIRRTGSIETFDIVQVVVVAVSEE